MILLIRIKHKCQILEQKESKQQSAECFAPLVIAKTAFWQGISQIKLICILFLKPILLSAISTYTKLAKKNKKKIRLLPIKE